MFRSISVVIGISVQKFATIRMNFDSSEPDKRLSPHPAPPLNL